MLVDTDNLVSAEKFRKHFDQYVDAARQGRGPVAVTQNSEVVGVFMSPEEYDAMFGHEIAALLKSREKGPTVSHEEVRKRAKQIIARHKKS
ncbi:MAG: type II toxin-antitoxin system Phd/YefM family antitoxin [Planctomycetaceae bacterium]|nr:type II toxin-antitoxin system Phd/YefM family antitoxin [Planctomycetaceae bacterium]